MHYDILKEMEVIDKVSGENQSGFVRYNYSSDDFSNNEFNIVSMIQKNYPNFSIAKFKQNAYMCFRRIQFALVAENPIYFRSFVTDKLYDLLDARIDVTKKMGYVHILEHFVVFRNFLDNYIDNGDEERIGIHLTITSKNYYIPQKKYDLNKNSGQKKYIEKGTVATSYYLEFVKKKSEKYSNDMFITNCPNCGAPLLDDLAKKCEHCKNDIVIYDSFWKLDKMCYWDERFL